MVEVKLRILGGGREVGRAAIAVGREGKYMLMDYGVNFNEEDVPQLPGHIKPSEVEAVAITHAHLDHIGAAPFLYTTAQLPILMTSITKELGRLMIQDFLKLSGYYLPFEQVDLDVMLDNVSDVTYGKQYEYGDFKVQFINAGHIPGSGMIYVDVDGIKVLYTGDVNTVDTRLVKGASLTGVRADVLVIEGTYGNSTHPSRDVVEKEFIDSVKEVVESGGNVLIPSFSLGRSQEIMALLAEKCGGVNVFYDGMVRVITELMVSHPEFIHRYELLTKAVEGFRAVRNSGDRRRIVKGESNVIVSSAGMLKGGPAQYYIKKLGSSSRNAVFMVSYQAPNTPGRKLLETGRLGGDDSPPLKARLQWFDFSSHAGVDGLMELASSVTGLRKIVVVHSDEPVGEMLKGRLSDIVGEENVFFPENGEDLIFDL